MPLPLLFARGEVRVVSINCGRGCQSRLNAMGLAPGRNIRVLHHTGGGVVVIVGDTRIAIGRGMAMKIYVEEV